jgi:hypothetical protein
LFLVQPVLFRLQAFRFGGLEFVLQAFPLGIQPVLLFV